MLIEVEIMRRNVCDCNKFEFWRNLRFDRPKTLISFTSTCLDLLVKLIESFCGSFKVEHLKFMRNVTFTTWSENCNESGFHQLVNENCAGTADELVNFWIQKIVFDCWNKKLRRPPLRQSLMWVCHQDMKWSLSPSRSRAWLFQVQELLQLTEAT